MYARSLKIISIVLIIFGLTMFAGCGGGGGSDDTAKGEQAPSLSDVKVVLLADSANDADALAFKSYLDTFVKSVDIEVLSTIASYDFTKTDLIIIKVTSFIYTSWSSNYMTQAQALKASGKPILTIGTGNDLYATSCFDLFINGGHSAEGCYKGIAVENANHQVWSRPENLGVSDNDKLILYDLTTSTPYPVSEVVYWAGTNPAPPAGAATLGAPYSYNDGEVTDEGIVDSDYSSLCYQVKDGVRYFHWAYNGTPGIMTANGKKLFKNVVYWTVYGDI